MKPWFSWLMTAVAIIVPAAGAQAGWSRDPSNNTVVVSSANTNFSSLNICPDGRGGAFFCWIQTRSPGLTDYRVNVQQVNAQGDMVWPLYGVKVSTLTSSQYEVALGPSIADNGLVAWIDHRYGRYNVVGQRVETPGIIRWPSNGMSAVSATNIQSSVQVIGDGSGGALVAWLDWRTGHWRPYIQRQEVNQGTPLWGSNGRMVVTNIVSSIDLRMVSDYQCGALLAWPQSVQYGLSIVPQVFAQRISHLGNMLWPSNGVLVAATTNGQWNHQLVCDDADGAIVTWKEYRRADANIYAQRISASGQRLWSATGMGVATNFLEQTEPQMAGDGAGGAVIVYQDAYTPGYESDINAQRIGTNGVHLWQPGGTDIAFVGGMDEVPRIVRTSTGDFIVAWRSERMNHGIFAQKINPAGQVQWATNGVFVGRADNYSRPVLTADKSGGAIILWRAGFGGTNEVRIQMVNASGGLGPLTAGCAGWELLLLE